MTGFTIHELTIPSAITPADSDAAAFEEMVPVRNRVETGILGSDALSHTAAGLLPGFRNPYKPRRLFVARVGGDIAARSILSWAAVEGSSVSDLNVEVAEYHRQRGIGTALLERLEALARESRRPTIQSYVLHSTQEGPTMTAPTGFGALPTADPGVRFLTSHGYTLEQVKRVSFLDVPVPSANLDALIHEARQQAGPEYEVLQWKGATPPGWIEDLAWLKTQMSLDDPTAGMQAREDIWSAQRILQRDRDQAESDRALLTAVALHLPTGRLAGFTELSQADDGGPAAQEDTLVASAHRGRRLGMLLKAANLAQLRSDTDLVYTFNAEENRPMLGVNESLGFRAVGYEGAWRKTL